MGTLTAKLTLSSASLSTDVLDLSTTTTFTGSHTSGLTRVNLKSISKICKIFILDGDLDVPDAQVHAGQHIDITDNYGLLRRYVFVNANGSGSPMADKATVVAASNLGDSVTPTTLGKLNLVGGIAVRIADGDQQHGILEKLRVVINAAEGHNGSITGTAGASQANAAQFITLANRDSLALPTVGNATSTFSILSNLITLASPAAAGLNNTNSQADHACVIKKGEYTTPAIYYMKNTAAYHANNNIVYLYWNDTAATPFMTIHGGQFAYLPADPQFELLAYTSTAGTVLEHMAVGTESAFQVNY